MKPISVFEYLLIISPSAEISRFVWRLKRIFADRYKCTMAVGSAPHITMGKWRRSNYDEARIISNLCRFAETVSPFIAQFDGLGNFKTETIFVNISHLAPFDEISKGLTTSTKDLVKKYVKFPDNAHLTIARRMEPHQFELAWSEWKNEEFKASCEVNEMILLRRPIHKERPGNYQTIATIPFRGRTPHIEQLQIGF